MNPTQYQEKCPKIYGLSLIFSFILIISLSTVVHAETYKVVRVYDGDTITIIDNGQKQSIRLVGIDTPEKSRKKHEPEQPYSQQATKYLAKLVLDKRVFIKSFWTDNYGRVLGVVYAGNTNVNLEMVRMGYAEVYRGAPAKGLDSNTYWAAENEARRQKLNIWSLGDRYISPRDWRRISRDSGN